MAKSAYHVKYLRISWTYLDLLYRFGRCTGGDDYPIFVWQSPMGRCYGNQLHLEDGSKHRQERPLLLASAFKKALADYCKSTFKILNCNIQATSCTNLVNLHQIFLEFTLLKRVIIAAIHPQFDDDLHSPPWHSKMNYMLAILISAE